MPDCQLYLLTPPVLEPAAFASDLAAALDTGDVPCVLLLPESLGAPTDDALRRAIDVLRPVTQDRGTAFLVDGRPDLAAETGCDGAHTCPDGPSYGETRALVGPNAIVGFSARFSRHAAMTTAEQGADYIVFGRRALTPDELIQTLDLIEWWASLMEVPCVALGDITPETCAPFVTAGADFVAVDTAVWNHPDGPAAGVKAMLSAIATAG